MSEPIQTFNSFHLGDQLVHLNFLRRCALANPDRDFIHYAQWQYLRELKPLTADVPNLELKEFGYSMPVGAIDSWRGANRFWYEHPKRNDFVLFHLEWFALLAKRMGIENPVTKSSDMLFNYPAMMNPVVESNGSLVPSAFDIMVINCPPNSGQFPAYNSDDMITLVAKLMNVPHRVIQVTPESGFSVTQIGVLSQSCHTIVMVSTGPSWVTWNVFNQASVKHRIVMLKDERIYLDGCTDHAETIPDAQAYLAKYGLI